jgi:hypothetical protein
LVEAGIFEDAQDEHTVGDHQRNGKYALEPNRGAADGDAPLEPCPKDAHCQPAYPLAQKDLLQEALRCETFAECKYIKQFADSMGSLLRPSENPTAVAHEGFGMGKINDAFKHSEARHKQQKKMNDWKLQGNGTEEDEETEEACQNDLRTKGESVSDDMAADCFFQNLEGAPPMRVTMAKWLEEQATDPKKLRAMGTEQLEVLGLIVDHLEYVLAERRLGRVPEQRVFLLLGQGGSGKTELVGYVSRLVRAYFSHEGILLMASSNSAARNLGGDTVHSCCGMQGHAGGVALDRMGFVQQKFHDLWKDVEVHLSV